MIEPMAGSSPNGREAGPASSPGLRLIDLPFDQYNRHTLVRRAVDAVRAGRPRLRVLDVGGYPCWTPRFLPDDDVTVLDVQSGPDVTGRFVLGDGSALPFRDGSFDIVVTLDSLEHVDRPRRERFLRELTRVARDYVVLTAPFFSAEVRLAEDLLFEFVKATLKAQHDQLTEHIAFALPEVPEVEGYFDAMGREHAHLPSGNVFNWLGMMLAKHFVMTLPDSDDLHRTLDRFYNTLFFEDDQREPAYRQLFLVAVGGDAAPMHGFVEAQRSPTASGVDGLRRLELAQLVVKLLDLKLSNHQDPRLREQVEIRDTQIRQLQGLRDILDAQLEEAKADIRAKDRAIETYQTGLAVQQGELERLKHDLRAMRARMLDVREEFAAFRVKAARDADEQAIETERYRIMLAARERDVEKLNEHIHRIASGRVMRALNAVQSKLG